MAKKSTCHAVFLVVIVLQLLVACASFILSTEAKELSTTSVDEKQLMQVIRGDDSACAARVEQAIRVINLSLNVEKALKEHLRNIGKFLDAIVLIAFVSVAANIYVWWLLVLRGNVR